MHVWLAERLVFIKSFVNHTFSPIFVPRLYFSFLFFFLKVFLSRGVFVESGSLSMAVSVQGVCPWGFSVGRPTPPMESESGQYAFYWNAFLLQAIFKCISSMRSHFLTHNYHGLQPNLTPAGFSANYIQKPVSGAQTFTWFITGLVQKIRGTKCSAEISFWWHSPWQIVVSVDVHQSSYGMYARLNTK